jgi:hypothetical protein
MDWIKHETPSGHDFYTLNYGFGELSIGREPAALTWIVSDSTGYLEPLYFARSVRLEEVQNEALYALSVSLSEMAKKVAALNYKV